MIDVITELSWRMYPALVIMIVGVATLAYGLRKLSYSVVRARHDPDEMQGFMVGFRIAVIGITMLGFGVSWNWNVTWLFVLALVFGAEEVVESSTHLAIIRRGKRIEQRIAS